MVDSIAACHIVNKAAVLTYAVGSAAGMFFFSINFGEEAVSGVEATRGDGDV